MRVNRRELTLWSFLMSSAHGAGLMVAPVLHRRRQRRARPATATHDGLARTPTWRSIAADARSGSCCTWSR